MSRLFDRKFISEIVQMVSGNIICAFALGCFALPFNMVVSGMSGIGRMVNYYTGMSVSMVVMICNATLFIIGWIMLGHKFAASIAIGTFVYPTFLGIFQNIDALTHLVDDPLLAAICAGVLNGVGLGLVLRVGGSTGGTDIPPIKVRCLSVILHPFCTGTLLFPKAKPRLTRTAALFWWWWIPTGRIRWRRRACSSPAARWRWWTTIAGRRIISSTPT